MSGFVKFLRVCELINTIIGKLAMLALKGLLMMPIWVIGFVVYLVMFKER